MLTHRVKTSFAAALLLFCMQVVAGPLLSCCSALAPVAESVGHADKPAELHSHAHHSDVAATPVAAEESMTPDADCEHQCNYCLGTSSTAVLDQRTQESPLVSLGAPPTSPVLQPRHLPDTLLRPPRST